MFQIFNWILAFSAPYYNDFFVCSSHKTAMTIIKNFLLPASHWTLKTSLVKALCQLVYLWPPRGNIVKCRQHQLHLLFLCNKRMHRPHSYHKHGGRCLVNHLTGVQTRYKKFLKLFQKFFNVPTSYLNQHSSLSFIILL